MPKYFTLIGSRSTPDDMKNILFDISLVLLNKGYIGRSGDALGADRCLTNAAKHFAGDDNLMSATIKRGSEFTEIYLPYKGFQGNYTIKPPFYLLDEGTEKAAADIVKEVHPNWEAVMTSKNKGKPFAYQAHTRNVCQILGKDLNTPSSVCILWAEATKQGVKGGTNTAYQLAKRYNIPTYNLFVEEERVKLLGLLNISQENKDA